MQNDVVQSRPVTNLHGFAYKFCGTNYRSLVCRNGVRSERTAIDLIDSRPLGPHTFPHDNHVYAPVKILDRIYLPRPDNHTVNVGKAPPVTSR